MDLQMKFKILLLAFFTLSACSLVFELGWNDVRIANTLNIQTASNPNLVGCEIVEKRVYG